MKYLIAIFLSLIFCVNTYAQYNITDENKALTPKEMTLLERVIDFQLVFYNEVLPQKPILLSEVKLNIYTDYAAYLIYQNEQRMEVNHRSMGFYSPKNKEAVVCKDKAEKRFLEICYHELSHFFTNTYFNKVPLWLNEGLAVYFSHLKISSKNITHNPQSYYVSRVKTMIDTRDIDLKDFVNWDWRKFQKMSSAHDNYGYAIGYTMILFLMEQDRNLVLDLIRQIDNGNKSIEAFDAFYKGGFNQFEIDYFKYIEKNTR